MPNHGEQSFMCGECGPLMTTAVCFSQGKVSLEFYNVKYNAKYCEASRRSLWLIRVQMGSQVFWVDCQIAISQCHFEFGHQHAPGSYHDATDEIIDCGILYGIRKL